MKFIKRIKQVSTKFSFIESIIIVILFSVQNTFVLSQSVNGKNDSIVMGCTYFGEPVPDNIKTLSSNGDARQVIERIVSIVGLKPNFETHAANIPNAAAVIRSGKRMVLYNPGFINRLNKATGNDWAAVSILAHEIGHHLNGHTLLSTGSRPEIELEADEFSGFVLRKMGASLGDAQAAMKWAASIKASHTHPAKADRLRAIALGWSNADAQMADASVPPKTNKNIKAPVITEQPEIAEENVLDDKYIAFDVNFFSDTKGTYFVTIRNNLVKVENNKLFIVGVMAQSNKKNYSGMFYDKLYNYLYITKNFDIVNGAGKKVGAMKKH